MPITKKKTSDFTSQKSTATPKGKSDGCNIENLIRERAYYIWESKGRPNGQDMTIWLQAKKDVSSKMK
jgi:hypothetical protein